MRRFVPIICAVVVCCGVRGQAQQSDLAFILSGLAERTQQYYDRFISIICTETVHKQDLRTNLMPVGRPRTTVYELSVSRDSSVKDRGTFRVERTLQSVNGRPARKNQATECTDPKTGTPEPLEFLLAHNQRRYRFALADAAGGPPGARALDFEESPPGARPHHVGRQLFRGRWRSAKGARVVRSGQLRRVESGYPADEAVSHPVAGGGLWRAASHQS